MKMIDLDLHPDRKRLRQFGIIALIAFGLLGAWARWKGHLAGIDLGDAADTVSTVLWCVAGLSGLFSLLWPPANRALYVLLILVAFPIGTVVSYVLMAFLFYVVITPVGLWFKIVRRDALHRRFEPDLGSYWVDHRPPQSNERYFKQF
jgi:hypothetical protein